MNWFCKQYRFATIPKGAILDIGSGSNPFWRANVLMERFLEDDSQRPGKLIVDRPMVCGDIHCIPFVDNAFSFVHCSHILEHVDFPEKAIGEITRVAKCGYIEIPSEIHEYLHLDLAFHRWAISAEEDVLVFREKPQAAPPHPLIEALRNSKNRSSQFISKHHSEINIISLFWHDEVNHRVERCDCPTENYAAAHEPSSRSGYALNQIKTQLKLRLGKLLSPNINIYDILACPICKHQIEKEDRALICVNCDKKFPIIEEVPMMIKEYASPI